MAYAVTALKNVQFHRVADPHEVFYIPGDPGVTFTKGELCTVSATTGVLALGTDSAANAVFRVHETTVCPAATQCFVEPADLLPRRKEAKDKTLVPVQLMGSGGGFPVYLGNIKNFQDETVVSYTASTRAVAMTTGFGADDRPNGGLAYVYEGPGIGEVNIIEDYDHTGGAAELLAIFHRAFKATLTTSSKIMVMASTAGANAVGPFGRMDLADEDELDVIDGADDGNYALYVDWKNLHEYLRLGQVPFVNVNAVINA